MARGAGAKTRRPFALLGRAALEHHVPEARTAAAHWGLESNLAWMRRPLEDGRFGYLALRRHLDWVTGEVGVSDAALDLEELPLLAGPFPGPGGRDPGPRWRIRLGALLHDEDRWWRVDDVWAIDLRERKLVELLPGTVPEMRSRYTGADPGGGAGGNRRGGRDLAALWAIT